MESRWSCIPGDIAHKIASLLQAADVCSLGRCSRFWHGICVSDSLWMDLSKRRWPMLEFCSASRVFLQIPGDTDEVVAHNVSGETPTPSSPAQVLNYCAEGWRGAYIYKHKSVASSVSAIKEFVEQCAQKESLEVGYYLKAISYLHSYQLCFKDVEVFLFSKTCNALLNLVGLHYCLFQLQMPPSVVLEALCRSHVSEREICISWYKLGRWFYGFRLHDERHMRKISLSELLKGEGDEVLGVLNRGAVHEVIRVRIAPAYAGAATSSLSSGPEN